MHYSGLVFQWRKNMETKKLVLGFWALAAVTGGVHRVFGAAPVSLKGLLREAIPDDGIRTKYEAVYDTMVLPLKFGLECFAKMGDDEVEHVGGVYSKQRRLHHLNKLIASNAAKVPELDGELTGVQRELTQAESALNGARLFAWLKQKVVVAWLTSKKEKVEQRKTLMAERDTALRVAATALEIDLNRTLSDLSSLRARRVVYVTSVCSTAVLAREASMLAGSSSGRSVGSPPLSDVARTEMCAIGNLASIHAAELMRCDLARVDVAVKKAAQQLPDDYTWFCENGGNLSLYNESQASFVEQADVYPGNEALVAQLDRVLSASDRCRDFEAAVRGRLKPLVESRATQRNASEGDGGHCGRLQRSA
jgi:hypothetical protein